MRTAGRWSIRSAPAPFVLKEWRRGQQIVLEANPGFRDERFPDSDRPGRRARFAEDAGQGLPHVGRVEIAIIEESNPRLLAFDSGALDYVDVPPELVRSARSTPATGSSPTTRRAA